MRRKTLPTCGVSHLVSLTPNRGRWPVRKVTLALVLGLILLSVSILYAKMARSDAASESEGGELPTLPTQSLTPDQLQQLRPLLGHAEGRLIEIYQLIGQGEHKKALTKAESLVKDHPNFHLAQLLVGDLMMMQTRPVERLGDLEQVPPGASADQLAILREESRRRMLALTQRPPKGHVPTQFLALSAQSRHAIAIDASRSRLYLFENLSSAKRAPTGAPRLRLISDFYISVGLFGIDKHVEGDKRTPLGVYYITSQLKPDNLPDFYGSGALPINYPNALDTQRGKTGSGIWLHGTPREQFVRAPQASDGCVVLSNPDLERIMGSVQIRTTPVIIAPELHWVEPGSLEFERQNFEKTLESWRHARSQGDPVRLKGFYATRFAQQGRHLAQWWPKVEEELRQLGARERQLKDVSILRWQDKQDTMVVTFGEVIDGQSRGVTRRQYWLREGSQWKIFFEGNA